MSKWYLDENDIDIYLKCTDDVRWHYNTKELVRILNDLEAKLAEKEHTINTLIEDHKASQEWYKMQLAESEEQLKEELEEKNGVRRALRACHHQNDEFADMIKKLVSEKEELKQQLFESGLKTLEEIKLSEQRKKMLEDLSTKNWELEQQLAEKEKEIALLNAMISTLPEHDKELEEEYTQDKISFAVEKLKETKIYVDTQHFMNARYKCEKKVYADIWNFIDNQIKQLKEGK